MTGLDLRIRSMDVGVLKSVVGIRGLTLRNPSGFPEPVMLDLPEIYVDYDLGAFLGGRVHLEEVRLDLKEFQVVKDRQGRLNLDALKVVQASKQAQAKPAPAGKTPEIQIDTLHLKIGKVIYKDYSRGEQPFVQEFSVNINERYQHITNPQAFAALVVSRALVHTTVARLTGLDVGALQSQLSAGVKELAGGAVALTGDAKAAAKDVAVAATDTVKQTAESLKKVLPFGQ